MYVLIYRLRTARTIDRKVLISCSS